MSIEAFKLHKERCKLVHLNLRSELHGEESSNAIDLKFEFDSANNLLAKLHPDLRATFYQKDANRSLLNDDHLPALRFPLLDPTFGWELEIPRTLLRIHGDTPENDIVLGGGKTNAFKLTLKEGGTVSWKFRVQFSKPAPEAIAALSRVLQQVVPVSLECRDEDDEKGGDLFEQAEKQAQQPMSEARRLAEQEFAKAGAQVDQLPATTGTPSDDPDFKEVGEAVFANDGLQPGDAGHSYAAAKDGDVVDAEYVPPSADEAASGHVLAPEQVETESVSIVTPIGRKRRTAKTGTGGNLE